MVHKILAELDKDINDAVHVVAARMKTQEAENWKNWVTKNIAAGARNAHRFLKLPEEWQPTAVLTVDGITTAAPTELIKGYASKYDQLWNGRSKSGDTSNTDEPWRGGRY